MMKKSSTISEEPETTLILGLSRQQIVFWGYALIFISVSVLSSSNPFRLFTPLKAFPLPVKDQRQLVELYGITTGDLRVTPIKRKMALSENLSQNVKNIAGLLSRLPEADELTDSSYRAEVTLPRLGFTIRKIWSHDSSHIIIDLRGKSIEEEIIHFFKNHQVSDYTIQMRYVDGFFLALTMSIFQTHREVEKISYLIDGKSEEWPGLSFDLSRTYHTAEMRVDGF